MAEHKSAVARIRQQIEDEAYAMYLALDGFACVGRHLIIAHKHRSIEDHREHLATLVGPEQATEMTMTTYLDVMEKSQKQPAGGSSKE